MNCRPPGELPVPRRRYRATVGRRPWRPRPRRGYGPCAVRIAFRGHERSSIGGHRIGCRPAVPAGRRSAPGRQRPGSAGSTARQSRRLTFRRSRYEQVDVAVSPAGSRPAARCSRPRSGTAHLVTYSEARHRRRAASPPARAPRAMKTCDEPPGRQLELGAERQPGHGQLGAGLVRVRAGPVGTSARPEATVTETAGPAVDAAAVERSAEVCGVRSRGRPRGWPRRATSGRSGAVPRSSPAARARRGAHRTRSAAPGPCPR